MPDRLHPTTDGFAFAALGLKSWIASLEGVMNPVDSDPIWERDGDDPALLALFGLLSVARSADRWLELASGEGEPPAPERTPRQAPREILR